MFRYILTLIVGAVIGGFAALTFGGGAMMGAGAATGLVTGMCMTVEAAQQTGLLTEAEIDQVMVRAAENAGASGLTEAQAVGSAAGCAAALAKIRAGQ